ncbi:MAG: TIM barrel protein [Planctomycetota bacterium]
MKHSVCRWCFPDLSLDDLCRIAVDLGIDSVELLDLDELPTLRSHGLACALLNAPRLTDRHGHNLHPIEHGWNDPANHTRLIEAYGSHLQQAAEAGVTHIVCFSGNRHGMSDRNGLANAVEGLKQIAPRAEALGVALCLELLNSKVDHPDYMADRTAWGVELCERVNSPALRLLYDIYHMQIMEGDLIATIRQHHRWFSHYHTAGVPGRHEIDDTQEINYPAVVRAIREAGYTGYLGQEFLSTSGDPIGSLREAVHLCS